MEIDHRRFRRTAAAGLAAAGARILEPAASSAEQRTGSRPRTHHDFRELLEEEEPEVAIVAAPDHRHPLIREDRQGWRSPGP